MAIVKDMDLAKAVFSDNSNQIQELQKQIELGEKKVAEMSKIIEEQKVETKSINLCVRDGNLGKTATDMIGNSRDNQVLSLISKS